MDGMGGSWLFTIDRMVTSFTSFLGTARGEFMFVKIEEGHESE